MVAWAQGPSVPGVSPSRRLLARLRDVMAGSGSGQARLDKIVRLIASEVVAEVCSCYVMRPGDVLELFATVGLKAEAVHKTRLRVGEGLVGEIAATAAPLAIANAPSHPKFAYRPETGEEIYQSLSGVPILRGGKVRGVLVIQNRQRRNYDDEEIETLQTVAMVVAELVTGGELGAPDQFLSRQPGDPMPSRLTGEAWHGGFAQGLAVLHRPQLTVRQMVADNPAEEWRRLRAAVDAMHSSLDALMAASSLTGAAESRDILETYRMFAEDRGWLGRMQEAINAGLTAEAAVQQVHDQTRARLAHVTDPYLRERVQDFEDLANRLLHHLAGKVSVAASGTLPEDIILVARTIGPAELLDYEQKRLRGLILEDGSPTSHVAIIARTLDIPVLGRVRQALSLIEPMDPVLIDAENGQAFIRPAEDVAEAFSRTVALRTRQRQEFAEANLLPATSLDGVSVSLNINAGMLIDTPQVHALGADGIGLYRTEIPFMVRSGYPDVEAQTQLYAKVLDQAEGKPVVFRTLDVGGDKLLPYFAQEQQENPALGWRALRIGLDRPAMLRGQLRALLRGAKGRAFSILLPMVAEVAEFEAAARLVAMETRRAAAEGVPVSDDLRLGTMLEVPSLLWQLPELLKLADFVAIGTNDLLQYLFAADRGNPAMASRYDPLSPPMLNMLDEVIAQCAAAGRPVSVCGEIAGRPLEALALVALGIRSLSMTPTAIGPVKAMIRSADIGGAAAYLKRLRHGTQHSLRAALLAFAGDRGIRIA